MAGSMPPSVSTLRSHRVVGNPATAPNCAHVVPKSGPAKPRFTMRKCAMKYREAMKIGKQLEGLFVRASKQVDNKLVRLSVSEDKDGQLVIRYTGAHFKTEEARWPYQ